MTDASSETPSLDQPEDHAASPAEAAGLVLVSTPIGNLGDMSFRGVEALRSADLILCEDTRHTARLLSHYAITTRCAPLHDHNEAARTPAILAQLRGGARVALVSDAGTPLVSDPGYRLVRAAIDAGFSVQAMPGANAATTALTLSALPPHPFMFLGFLPPKQAARRAECTRLRSLERAGMSATLIFYEAPHRLPETLADLAAIFGDRDAAVARELTKRFEEVRRGALPALAAHYANHPARGEITLVLGPAETEIAGAEELDALLTASLSRLSLREAVASVAEATALPRKQVYARALHLQKANVPSEQEGVGR